MLNFFRKLVSISFVKSIIVGQVRHALSAGGAVLLAWLLQKHADPVLANNFVQSLIGTVMLAGGLGWSMFDKSNVDDRLKATAAVGTVVNADQAKTLINAGVVAQHDADQSQADKVKAAIDAADAAAPKDKAELLAALAKGNGQ